MVRYFDSGTLGGLWRWMIFMELILFYGELFHFPQLTVSKVNQAPLSTATSYLGR